MLKYQYTNISTDIVAQNIDEYIIPECQKACKDFWEKNIMTFMCSNYDEIDDTKYVLVGKLSKENKEKFEKLILENPKNYYYSKYRSKYGIRVNGNDKQVVEEKLTKLVKIFEMQDICEGKMTSDEFLIDIVGLAKYKRNPEYDEFWKQHPMPNSDNYDDMEKYNNDLLEYTFLEGPSSFIIEVDKSKIKKSLEEYIDEYGYKNLYDKNENIIFQSEFYKNAHLKYLKYKKQMKIKKDTEEMER